MELICFISNEFSGKMATSNPEEADFTCKNRECPKGVFKWNTILIHIARAKNCKIFYSEEEINVMRENSKKTQKASKRDNSYNQSQHKGKSIASKSSGEKSPSQKNEKTRTQCKSCKELFMSLIAHLNRNQKCQTNYGLEYGKMKISNEQRRKNYKLQNKGQISQSNAAYFSQNKGEISKKRRKRYFENKKEKIKKKTSEQRIHDFKRQIIHGPNYTCFSCKRCLFKCGVQIFTPDKISKMIVKLEGTFLRQLGLHQYCGNKLMFCHNCLNMIRKNKLPKIHVSNGLQLDIVPPELQLTDLEQQLIARSLLFMMVKKLPCLCLIGLLAYQLRKMMYLGQYLHSQGILTMQKW